MTRRGDSGVSQLELMISLAIMGLIAVLLANALNFNRQSLDRTRQISAQADARLAGHALRSWADAVPLDQAGAGALLTGGADSLRFVFRPTDGTLPPGGLAEVTVQTRPTGRGTALILRLAPVDPSPDAQQPVEQVLAADIQGLKLRYFGRLSTQPEPAWHDTWADALYLPDLVKIEWEPVLAAPAPPLTLRPGRIARQSEMSLSSLVPPG